MAAPRIAVLIASYNAENTIEKALDSLASNAEPHDIVVVDDGSRKPLKDCIAPRNNLTIIRLDKNGGVTRAANTGLRYLLEKNYDYIARLDADDAAVPDRLAIQRAFMDANPDVALSGGGGEVVTEDGKVMFYLNHPTDHATILRELYYNSCFLQPTFIIRASALREMGLYDEHYPNAEDYELARRLATRYRLANVPDYLIRYTLSPGGLSIGKRHQQLGLRLEVQWKYRNFANIHFYLGILKTAVLWMLPVSFITALKQRLSAYKKR
jgi:glycosyltransferase involved in cell wall biosynthesis